MAWSWGPRGPERAPSPRSGPRPPPRSWRLLTTRGVLRVTACRCCAALVLQAADEQHAFVHTASTRRCTLDDRDATDPSGVPTPHASGSQRSGRA